MKRCDGHVHERASDWLRRWLNWTGLDAVVSPERIIRAVGYGGIGVTGMGVDMAIVWGLAHAGVSYLIVTVLAYLAAMTWNFGWQRRYVFEASSASLPVEFARYFVVDVIAFGVRLGVVVVIMEVGLLTRAAQQVGVTPLVPASLIGIGIGFLVGFDATDTFVFDS